MNHSLLNRLLNCLLDVCFWLCVAVVAYVVLQVFVITSFHIPSDSMQPALVPGDRIWVDKVSGGARLFWDSIALDVMKYYVKRCIAVPGDTLEIRGGWYRIRGVDEPLGNPAAQREIALLPDSGAPGVVMETYPWDKELGWTVKEFGPLPVPRRGQTVWMDSTACRLYHTLVSWEQKRPLRTDSLGRVLLGDSVITSYTFCENYYFVGGDKARNSQDSRYWGLLPEAYIVGRAWRVWWSEEPYGDVRWERVLKRIE